MSGLTWVLEVDVSLEELADIMGEELELPNIRPKNKEAIVSQKDRYTSISRTGPESLVWLPPDAE